METFSRWGWAGLKKVNFEKKKDSESSWQIGLQIIGPCTVGPRVYFEVIFLWHWWILPRDHHWISRRIGVGLEEAPSLHSHAGQVFNALLSTTLSFESDPDFRHLCSLSFILIIYHLQAIRELTGRYFGQVSHRVKKKLATIYKNDFLMFGYNPLIWVGEKISFIIDSVILLNFGAFSIKILSDHNILELMDWATLVLK